MTTAHGPWLMLIFLLAAGTARAELTWEQKTVELHADAKSSVLEARYRFTNAGDKPVDIRDVQTSCGCTTAALEQRHYEPGQTGEIVARFAVGDRVGLQKKQIMVTTSDLPMPTSLTLIVHVPQMLRLQPAFVTWQPGEAADAKEIEIIRGDGATTLENLSVQSSSPAMSAELSTVAEGSKYRLRIQPQTTDHAFFATLTIHCRVGTEEKTFHAFASVQRAPPAPPTPHAASAPPVAK